MRGQASGKNGNERDERTIVVCPAASREVGRAGQLRTKCTVSRNGVESEQVEGSSRDSNSTLLLVVCAGT